VLVTRPDQQNEILFMANHFFMDFYSVAWVVAQVFDIYKERLGGQRRIPVVKPGYLELCRWLDAKQRDAATAKRVLHAIDQSKPAIVVPPMFPSIYKDNSTTNPTREVRIHQGMRHTSYRRPHTQLSILSSSR
jgi:hypothetical protein